MPSVEPAGTALFLKRWLRRPLAMGAVVPSGRLLAEAMAQAAKAAIGGRAGPCRRAGRRHRRGHQGAAGGRHRAASGWRWSSATPSWPTFLRRHFPRAADHRGRCRAPAAPAGRPRRCRRRRRRVEPAACCRCRPSVVNGIVDGVFEALPRGGGAGAVHLRADAARAARLARAPAVSSALRGKRIWRNVPPAVVWTFTRPAAA